MYRKRTKASCLPGFSSPPRRPGWTTSPPILGRPVKVITDGQDGVAKVAVERSGVVLALGDVEESARRLAGTMLGDDHRGAHDPAASGILGDEHIRSPERVSDLAFEAPDRMVDDPHEGTRVIGQVYGVEHLGKGGEALQVRPLGVSEEEHGEARPLR